MSHLELLARSGTVGAGGAGFPTHAKLSARAEILIANGAECEPLLHANQELLMHEAPQVLKGLLAAGALIGAARMVVAVKAKYKQVVARLREAAAGTPMEICELPDFYPVGDEQAVVAEVTGRIVPENGLPLDVGVVVCNVETLANVGRALAGTPVTHKWVTVTGAVREPVTLRVPVGTPVGALVEAAGGATVRDWAALDGGPMMGRPVTDHQQPVTKTTGGLIVLPADHPVITRPQLSFAVEARRARTTCVRCTLCTQLCPRYLQGHDLRPHQVMQSLALFPTADALYDQAWLCCECGICEVFSCPMGLSPRRVLGALKREFGAQGRRYPKAPKSYSFRPDRAYRRIPGSRLLQRLGLAEYDRPAPLRAFTVKVGTVTLPLRQHIGVPAVPLVVAGQQVQEGQLIAEVPTGKLGAALHASVSGVVISVTEAAIRIREVGAHE